MAAPPGQLDQRPPSPGHGRVVHDIAEQSGQRPPGEGVGPVDRAIADLASRQHGNVSRRQLFALGLTRGAVDHRIACGRLHIRFRGVYLVGHVAEPPYSPEFGATLAGGAGAVVSHRTAAEVLEVVKRREPRGDIDISIPSRSGRAHDGIRVHRMPALDRRDTGYSHGVPITSPARTLLDFATQAELRELERAFHEAIVQRLVTAKQIAALLARTPGHHGVPLLRALVDDGGDATLTRSEAEELMLALVRSARLPRPEVNARLHGYEVDFLWRDRKLVVEVDGGRWHGNRAALERDHRKNAHLRARGFAVLRYTFTQIRDDRDAVVAELARATAAPPR